MITKATEQLLLAELDEYVQFFNAEDLLDQINIPLMQKFVTDIFHDPRLQEYTWYIVGNEYFTVNGNTETCRVWVLGNILNGFNTFTSESLVDKFVSLALETGDKKEIYVYLPIVITTPLSRSNDTKPPPHNFQDIIGNKAYASWTAFL